MGLEKISGVIFDLDGTLLDTMTQWNNLGADYLRELGIEPEEDLLAKLETMSLRESAEYFRQHYGVQMTAEEISAAFRNRIVGLYLNDALPKRGALETLEFLHWRDVKIALATATSSDLAQAGLRRVGALQFFDVVVSCRDPEIRSSKDSPLVYEAARERLGTLKEETVVVEDALYAIKTAQAAGFFTIAIEDPGERVHKREIQSTADIYVENHKQLLDYFQEML